MFNQEQLAAVAAAMSILQSMQPNAQTTTSPTATNCPATDLLLGDAVNNNNNNTNASALAAAQQQLAATWASTRQHHQQQQQQQQLQIQQLQQQFQHTHLDQAGPPKQSYLQQLQQQLQQHQHQQQLHQLQHQRPQLTSLPSQLPPHLTQQLPHLTQLPHLQQHQQQHQQQQPQQLQQTHVQQQHQQTPQQQSQLHLNPSLNNHRTNTTATSAKAVEVNKPIPYSAIVAKSAGLAPTTTRTNATAIVSNHNAGLVSTNNSNHNNTGASNNHHQQLGVSTNHNHQLGSNSNSISINNHNQNNIISNNNNNSSSISNILNNTSASKATNNFTTNNTSTIIAPTATITSQSIVNNHHPESGKATNLLGYMGLYVGNLSPDLSKEQLEKIFSMYGEPVKAHRLIRSPVAFIKYENTESPRAAIDDLYGILLPGMTLNQDQPLKLHFDRNDAQLKANYRPTELPKEDNGECYGWRTTVCRKGKNCPKKHIPINRGIDFQMWMIKSNLTTGTVPTTATSS